MTNSKPKTIEIAPCMGIPVVYDPELEVISDSSGVWRWKKICVGRAFLAFPPREQQALLLHEAGHCKMDHVAKLALFVLRSPMRVFSLFSCAIDCARQDKTRAEFFAAVARRLPEIPEFRMKQEVQADRFAAGCGYGPDLARAFGRLDRTANSPFHPPIEERVARLLS